MKASKTKKDECIGGSSRGLGDLRLAEVNYHDVK
jgi:hypothetical protein